MLSEEFPVEVILEAIDSMAPPSETQPKVILFDIGGVCVSNIFRMSKRYSSILTIFRLSLPFSQSSITN